MNGGTKSGLLNYSFRFVLPYEPGSSGTMKNCPKKQSKRMSDDNPEKDVRL